MGPRVATRSSAHRRLGAPVAASPTRRERGSPASRATGGGARWPKEGGSGPLAPPMDVLYSAFTRLRRALARGSGSADPPPALPGFGRLSRRRRSEHPEFDDLLSSLGADGETAGPEHLLERKDAEIAELRGNLEMLRPLGDRLAETERARLALEAKVRDLETIAREESQARRREAEEHERAVAKLRARLAEERTSAYSRDEHTGRLARQCEELRAALEAERARAAELEARLAELQRAAQAAPGPPLPRKENAKRATEFDLLRARYQRLEKRYRSLRARFEERDAKATERWHELRALRRRLRESERRG